MPKSQDHRQLMKIVGAMATREKWQRMPKKKGKVVLHQVLPSGNIKIELESGAVFYVLKRNTNLYAVAESLKKGDMAKVALRRQLGKYYCVKIANDKRQGPHRNPLVRVLQ